MRPSATLKFSRALWSHQSEALDRFAKCSYAGLFHEMGVGKTTTSIGWLRLKFNQQNQILPTLIVSPVATLDNWQREFEINSPKKVFDETTILYGSAKKRIAALIGDERKIWITNPETFDMPEVVEILRTKKFKCLVVDEAHRFKNHRSKRFQALLKLADSIDMRMILTGTPILNSYLDLWAQFRLLDQGKTFGQNFFVFREKYFMDKNLSWKGKKQYFPNYVPKPGIEKDITEKISKLVSRVEKSACLDLPPLVKIHEYVPLSPEQERLYREMEEELITSVKYGDCVATNALVKVLRMLQILSGYIRIEGEAWQGEHKIKDNPRLKRLQELLEELTPNHKVIVWCVFNENYKSIKDICADLKIEYAELTGETKDRKAQMDKFNNDPKCRVMISNPQAGGTGVNLIAASYAIYYSRSYSLGDRLQSEARNYRGGSEIHEKITLIDIVAKNTLDEDVLAALNRKEDFSNNILDRLKKK